ncbi:MAG TPA: peptidoglycan-binding protein [Candidatus Paceibacterota bacterium]
MKKYLIGGVLVIALIAYSIFANNDSSSVAVAPATGPSGTPSTTGPTSTPTTTPPSGNPPGTATSSAAVGFGFGTTGSQVLTLQKFLITNNYLAGVSAPTGYFGPMTLEALMKFQAANGISPATGYTDAQTLALVNSGAGSVGTTATTTGQYKDGTYTGSVADAFYGKLQATVVIQGGAIVDVQFPQAPSGGHSGQVSAFALPQLRQEAITAQSANVNIVSGATQDSEAFQQSLASALAEAKS